VQREHVKAAEEVQEFVHRLKTGSGTDFGHDPLGFDASVDFGA
jgi:hypothetical protein